jgi:uncharacterized CHY-type Zn-finger protein
MTMPCIPGNRCIHRLAAGEITTADLCPVCTSYFIAACEWIVGEQLNWHQNYLDRATTVVR